MSVSKEEDAYRRTGATPPSEHRRSLSTSTEPYAPRIRERLEKGLGWEVYYNGKIVLGRNAENEFVYRYGNLKPCDYTIYPRDRHHT